MKIYLVDQLVRKSTEANKRLQLHMEVEEFRPKQLRDWFRRAREEVGRVYQAVLTVREYGIHCEQRPTDPKGFDKAHIKNKGLIKPTHKRPRENEVLKECTACGRANHAIKDCHLNNPANPHPDVNKS